MQLQTQVPRRDWSSAAATSIPQPRLVPLIEWGEKNQPTHTKQQADRFGKHLQQIKL